MGQFFDDGSIPAVSGHLTTTHWVVVYGRHVVNWWTTPAESPPAINTVSPWTGANERVRRQNGALHLYRTTWENPRPDAEIATLEFRSARTATGPFLLGITLEP